MFDITPYRFLKWRAASFCCGDYVRLIFKDYFGATLAPAEYSGGGPSAAAEALKRTSNRALFCAIPGPKDMCVVEMKRYRNADHVGVYVIVDGQPFITHCERGTGVSLSTLDEIAEHYEITGYYEYVGAA